MTHHTEYIFVSAAILSKKPGVEQRQSHPHESRKIPDNLGRTGMPLAPRLDGR